jgi:hypothetical protein
VVDLLLRWEKSPISHLRFTYALVDHARVFWVIDVAEKDLFFLYAHMGVWWVVQRTVLAT